MTDLALHGFVSADLRIDPAALPAHRGIDLDGLVALVTEIEADLDTPEQAQAAALAHHALISGWHRRGSVLPVRLGTVFSSETALKTALSPRVSGLCAALDSLAGKEEMVLTIAPAAQPSAPAPPPLQPTNGADWLRARKTARDRGQARQSDRQETLAELRAALHARGVQLQPAPPLREGGLRWHLLIARGYRAELDRWLAAQSPKFDATGLDVTLDGPWPPYHFASDIMEALDG